MSQRPTFNDVSDFVRDWARIPAKKRIVPDTQFERDLGITGDDGSGLLQAAQQRFKVIFTDGENGYRTLFKLGPNEYLFNAEGFSLGGHTVRSFTVGELFAAIQQAPSTA